MFLKWNLVDMQHNHKIARVRLTKLGHAQSAKNDKKPISSLVNRVHRNELQ